MGLTATAMYAVRCANAANVHRTVAALLTSAWKERGELAPMEVATFGEVVVVPDFASGPIQAERVSAAIGDAAVLLTIMVFESDVAEVHAYESGERVASALFGLPGLAAMAEESNLLIEMSPDLAEANGWTTQPVPTDAVYGEAWWMSQLPNISPTSLSQMASGHTVFVEERVVALLEPLGVTEALLHAARGGFSDQPTMSIGAPFLGQADLNEPRPDELTEIGDIAAARAAAMRQFEDIKNMWSDHLGGDKPN